MSSRWIALALGVLAATSAVDLARGAGAYPQATAWSPMGRSAPLEGPILITWTMRMDATSVEGAFVLANGSRVWDGAAFQWVHSSSPPWTSRATPLSSLPASTTFVALVAPNATDASGRYPLDQDGNGVGGEASDTLIWTFRTENGTPPRVLATWPGDGQTDVRVTADIILTFDEPMDADSVTAAFGISPSAAGSFTWDTNGTHATLNPALNLGYGTSYAVRLSGGIAKDANGHPLDGNGDGIGGDEYRFSFTTESDTVPPHVVEVTPVPGRMSASVTANIEIRFSEAMNRGSVEDSFSYTDRATAWKGSNGSFSWRGIAFADDTVAFNPFLNFPFSRTLAVSLNGSSARDAAGFTLDGDEDGAAEGSPADDYGWSFATEPTDTTGPFVTEIDPPDGARGVFETATVALGLSEAMNRTSVEDALVLNDGFRTWTRADGWFDWGRGDDRVEFVPAANLAFDRTYVVIVAAATAKDVNGNPLDGNRDGVGGDDFSARFRTRAQPDVSQPRVVNTLPADGATGVSRTPVIAVTFDDVMSRSATEHAFALARATANDTTPVPIVRFEWSAADRTVSFHPSVPLDWDTWHRVDVSQAARDDADLPLAAPFTFFFRTEKWSGRVAGIVVADIGPVAEAIVTLGNWTTETSPLGSFEFPAVEAGRYNLSIAKVGYETKRLSLEIAPQDVDPATGAIKLGAFVLRTMDRGGPVLAFGTLLAVAAAIVVVVVGRRRRGPPVDWFEDTEPDYGEAVR